MALYEFKPNSGERGSRMQNIEEAFNKGMQFTNTPLPEGFSRVMVNYDLVDSGAALAPRPGLQATHMYIPEDAEDQGFGTIVASKEQHLDADHKRMQLLTIQKQSAGNGYDLKVITGLPEAVEKPTEGSEEYQRCLWHNYRVSDPMTVFCRVPAEAEIHGLPIDNEVLAMHAGVFAWNENYYFFDAVNNKMVHTEWDSEEEKFVFESFDPKELTPKEAVSYGYNMLLDQPYHFTNTAGAAGTVIQLQGMMPYDAQDNLCLTPLVNQSLSFEVFYQVPIGAKYYLLFEWRTDTDGTWTKIDDFEVEFSELKTIRVPFSPPNGTIIVRAQAYGYTDNTRNEYVDATLAVGFNFDRGSYGNTANIQPKTYSIATATGMTYWKNRLFVWGVPEDQRMLFASDLNDPTYFPYPNNTDTFDEPIKYAKPFMDDLLVWTSTELWLLTLSGDGLSWSKELLQSNLSIADWDIHLIQTVKNMLFFRSGNYYYMIVPKANSATGALALASISKPMYYFFDKFGEYVKQIISQVYGSVQITFKLKHYYNYLDFEDVHNVYVLEIEHTKELLNFDVIYSTVDRNWRIYLSGSPNIVMPYKQDMTQKGTLCVASEQDEQMTYQLLQYTQQSNKDFYNTDNFAEEHVWKNWQGLDTGYREHDSNFKKRYREGQFIVNNRSNEPLKFYTDFFIDGEQRRNRYKYVVQHNIDETSPQYGQLTVERIPTNELTLPGATVLDVWELGVDVFPDTSFAKIRFPVSGKGYTPRMLLVSYNELPYELLNVSWVYRMMFSR